ncbi:MAG: acetylornithine/succinylornithine family transaminase [Planctomycetota bacterium]|jgi:acetylornithine/N-succinyldiaminopimelate aminotransferase
MNTQNIINLFEKHVIPNYNRMPCAIARGEGSRVWDVEGKEYLDLFPGWGVSGLGHCHPAIKEAVCRQSEKLFHMPNNFYIEEQGLLAEIMGTLSGFDGRLFFCNSGAEAAEAAIKLARLHTGEGKANIITAENSFHGRTFAAISATGQPAYREGFAPTVPGFTHIPYNDIEALRAAVDGETSAIMLEPVQGEGGVIPADLEYLKSVRALCDEKGIVLIFDEVQTSPGRLGKVFGYQHFSVNPDIMTTAKSLAGGIPMGAIMVKPELALSLKPGTHASTFGGSPIACAAALAVFKELTEGGLLENINKAAAYFSEKLADLKNQDVGIKEIRQCGLMIGIEIDIPGAGVVRRCMDEGLLVNCTHDTVIRMLPAYNITTEEIDHGLDILKNALTNIPVK